MWTRDLFGRRERGASRPPPARHGTARRRPVTRRLTVEALDHRILPASLMVSDAMLVEGNAGTRYALVRVSLDVASAHKVTVDFNTANGTAVAGSDYRAVSGRLTFFPGETSRTIPVPVIGDRHVEPDETFVVNVSGAKGAKIADGQGVVTILNDESRIGMNRLPGITVSGATIIKGNDGVRYAVVRVSLDAPTADTVTVNYTTANGTAVAASDYQAVSSRLSFAGGETGKSILVPVIGDRLAEPNETFVVNLSGAKGAAIARSQGVVTILDDEPRISIYGMSASEGNSGTTLFTFSVSLSAAYDQTVTVTYATADGTATIADHDYSAAAGTLTFAPGDTTKTITIAVVGDTTDEPDETFGVNLRGASSNALIVNGNGIGSIIDDDLPSMPGDPGDGCTPDNPYYPNC